MTLSVRRGILALAFGAIVLLAAGYGVLSFLLVRQEGWTASVGRGTLMSILLETLAAPLTGLVGFLLVRHGYRKSGSPELFFFALFLAALAGEALLTVQAWLTVSGQAAFFTGLVTRVVWAFRLAGLLFLFCGSLFAFDFAFRRYGNLVALSVAAGVSLAVLVPLQSTAARNHLLFAVGDSSGLVLVTVILSLVVVVNFVLGARRAGAPEGAWARAGAAVSFLTAWALTIVFGPAGSLAAIPGLVFVVWKGGALADQ